ncbi:hypothetical protein Rs2_04334 [Raphanus sativus]|uniref:Uncharacterized protein LOC108841742 n=1 Tax=Raphanus sativus TaxID=3726 RepID=A0A6J0MC57_RAPSA|nr:uncharacterized protein LOC108841742 [Raphanus sativus]KAJ4909713.1 hypothetical protein Rs2_04334 [Raphanus sativus]
MTELKWICLCFSLTLLLSLAVGSHNTVSQKWSVGNHFGYDGGFCLPGLCIRGAGGSRVNFGRGGRGRMRYNGGRDRTGIRETMYCKPLTCWSGSCDALHLHLDKGLYKSLVAAKQPSTVDYKIPETFKHNNVNDNYEVQEAAMTPQSN